MIQIAHIKQQAKQICIRLSAALRQIELPNSTFGTDVSAILNNMPFNAAQAVAATQSIWVQGD